MVSILVYQQVIQSLLVISRMILKMIDGVSKPALADCGLIKWNECCFRFRANIECSEQNLVDFAELGSALLNLYFLRKNKSIFIKCWI